MRLSRHPKFSPGTAQHIEGMLGRRQVQRSGALLARTVAYEQTNPNPHFTSMIGFTIARAVS